MRKVFTLCLLAVSSVLMMAQSYPENVYMVGSATPVGWTPGVLPMYSNGDGTYEYVGMLYNGDNGNEFKMLTSSDWTPSYGPKVGGTAIEAGKDYELEVRENDGMGDNKFTVKTEGRYHLTLNLVTNKLAVAAATEGEADKNGLADFRPANMYIVGSGCGAAWTPGNAIAMTYDGQDTYTLTTTIYGHTAEEEYNEIKFLSKQEWAMPQFGPLTDGELFTGEGEYTVGIFVTGDNKYHNTTMVTEVYDFTINLATNKMQVKKHEDEPTALDNVKANVNAKKVLRNGQLYILNNEEVFTATGARIK